MLLMNKRFFVVAAFAENIEIRPCSGIPAFNRSVSIRKRVRGIHHIIPGIRLMK
jgi:hypothetical protein